MNALKLLMKQNQSIYLTENENNYECTSGIVYIILMIVAFTISAGIAVYLVYYSWYLINNNNNNHKKIKI